MPRLLDDPTIAIGLNVVQRLKPQVRRLTQMPPSMAEENPAVVLAAQNEPEGRFPALLVSIVRHGRESMAYGETLIPHLSGGISGGISHSSPAATMPGRVRFPRRLTSCARMESATSLSVTSCTTAKGT